MMKTIVRIVLLAIATLTLGVTGQFTNYEEGRFAFSSSRPQSCERIISVSRFYGTCCSLNATLAGGCVVNVKNGWCRIIGQYWSNTWNSTDDRITCDPSEFEIEYISTDSPSIAPSRQPSTAPSRSLSPSEIPQPSSNPSGSDEFLSDSMANEVPYFVSLLLCAIVGSIMLM
ncbi:unnamed protein product [Cylindrotheca closterium]|uniref:Uncharacterized protein n=1 Tax=Cylindrotheca closterium TaxID=2856 RepID=A0AAD2G7N9_9STRA|nr:unnamed protein product [Cylindrotheca closterium]